MKLILATRNQGKVRELTNMLYRCGNPPLERLKGISSSDVARQRRAMSIVSLESYPDAPEVVEDGKTYMENAIKKASIIAEYTSHLTLADDAGLEVDALGGAPGINSKRWAGEDATDDIRIAKLLQALEGATHRRARFIAAIAVVHPNSDPAKSVRKAEIRIGVEKVIPLTFRLERIPCAPTHSPKGVLGVCEGHIRHDPVGESGFGYDPVFVPDGYNQTFAELGEEIKNRISHRAKALEQAIALL